MKYFTLCLFVGFVWQAGAQSVELKSWLRNTNNATAVRYDESGSEINLNEPANVQKVQYSTDFVYVSCSGLPSYKVGPFLDGNPSTPGNQSYVWKIPRNPKEETGTKTEPGLGPIAVLINGVPMYNAEDAMTYNNGGIWHRDAVFFENDGFDCAKGHPSPNMQGGLDQGYYHHHQLPISFTNSTQPKSDVCTKYPSDALLSVDKSSHSPIIGFAFDGFPIYGPYGYSNTDGTGDIVLMKSSYQLRDISDRTTLADGAKLKTNEYGPAINSDYPLGAFIEDYEYVEGSGHLDQSNGRFCVTPEYPNGTYCYFATADDDLNSTYPYFIGPEYYGVVEKSNISTRGKATINEAVTEYTGPSSYSQLPNWKYEVNSLSNGTIKLVCKGNEPVNYSIYSLSGSLVATGKTSPEGGTIVFDADAKEIYLLKIFTSQQMATVKIYHDN
ncbi:YHYH protein [bacterium]|nr:YHYH protein [bacterium]